MSRDAISRSLAVAHVPRKRHAEFLAAFRRGGIAAVRALDERVAELLEIEARFGGAVLLDTRGQWERERLGPALPGRRTPPLHHDGGPDEG